VENPAPAARGERHFRDRGALGLEDRGEQSSCSLDRCGHGRGQHAMVPLATLARCAAWSMPRASLR